jgi:hypothetical protein
MSGWRAATMAKEEILRGGCMLRRPLEAQRRARGPPVEQIDAVHFLKPVRWVMRMRWLFQVAKYEPLLLGQWA